MGLKAGDELEERCCPLDPLIFRRAPDAAPRLALGKVMLFGSYDAGIEINEGLPIDCPPLIGPKVGVDEADFTVAEEVSALLSKVMVLSTRVFPPCCCEAVWRLMFRKVAGVAAASSFPVIESLRFGCGLRLDRRAASANLVEEEFRGGGGGIDDEGRGSGDTESEE
jgi:hypothetical protein